MKLICIVTVMLIMVSINTYAQNNYTFCYDPYPPYTIGKSGTPTGGLKVQLIDAIFKEIDHVQVEVILLPWRQCQNQTKLGHIDGILPLFKNDERASYMMFSDSVFDQVSAFWYKRSQFPEGIQWDDFKDISHLKLGMLIGGFIDQEMESTFEDSRGIHRGKSVENLFQVLLKERVDLVAIDAGVGRYVLQEQGWQDDIAMVTKPIGLQESYIGLSKKSSVANLMEDINQVIKKLHKDGTIDRIRNSTDY